MPVAGIVLRPSPGVMVRYVVDGQTVDLNVAEFAATLRERPNKGEWALSIEMTLEQASDVPPVWYAALGAATATLHLGTAQSVEAGVLSGEGAYEGTGILPPPPPTDNRIAAFGGSR